MATVNLAMAESFLRKFGLKETFTFQTFDDKKPARPGLAQVFHGTFDQHANTLINLNERGAGVFVMVNRGDGVIHKGKQTCRTNANVISIRALFADADGVPIRPILKKTPLPHIIVESSPGKWHLYWLTHDTPLEAFTARQSAIAQLLGTDPAVKDLARVMRLPGFFHQKGASFMSRLVLPE